MAPKQERGGDEYRGTGERGGRVLNSDGKDLGIKIKEVAQRKKRREMKLEG